MGDSPSAQAYGRISRLVREKLKAKGMDIAVLGPYEVRKVIHERYDALSDDDENSDAVVRFLARRVQHYERTLGPLSVAPAKPLENHLLQPRHAMAWATLDPDVNPRLAVAIEAVRVALWGDFTPPFSAWTLGLDAAEQAAQAWLLREQLQTMYSSRMTLQIDCSVTDLVTANQHFFDVFNMFADDQEWWNAGRPLGPLLYALGERLKDVTVATGAEPALADLPAVLWQDAGDSLSLTRDGEQIRVPLAGPLRQLYEGVRQVTRASGWWQPWQALHHVMTGYPPAPQQFAERHHSGRRFYSDAPKRRNATEGRKVWSWPAWTVTVEGAMGAAEWQRLMPRSEGDRSQPKRVSRTHVALLQLKAQTAGLSWRERHKVWEQWCQAQPELSLKRFGDERLLRKEWERAVLKVNKWAAVMSSGK